MSHRFLRRGLLSAALFGAATLAPLVVAKPPDLPAEIKNVATPVDSPEDGLILPPPPVVPVVDQAGCTLPATEASDAPAVEASEPAFYRLHLADRKTMTACLLFGVNPLLALTPPEMVMYWPAEVRETLEDATTPPDAGTLMFGVGINSDVVPETPAAPPTVSVCPYLNQPKTTPAPIDLGRERTVLDNLQALEESDRLLESAKEMLHTGRVCEAVDFFEKIARLCPGSRYAEMADALVAEVLKHFPAAAEKESETTPLEGQLRVHDTPLTHIFSDLLNGEGLNFYLQSPPVPQEEESEEQEVVTPEAKKQELERHLNMPVTLTLRNVPLRLVLEDLSHNYGLNIRVDETVLAERSIAADRLVTCRVKRVPLQTAFYQLLKSCDLTYFVKDGVIQITTPDSLLGCVEPGAHVMAESLLKAARLALENGRTAKAADLARQAFALDPQRVCADPELHRLYLLVEQPGSTTTIRINNVVTVCPCRGTTAGIAGEPSLRPNLPGVDPRVVAAMEKVLAEAETKRASLSLVIEEEQEPRLPSTSIEIAQPFVLDGATTYSSRNDLRMTRAAWQCLSNLVPADDCVDLLKEVADFQLSVVLSEEGGKSWAVSLGLLGCSVDELSADEDE